MEERSRGNDLLESKESDGSSFPERCRQGTRPDTWSIKSILADGLDEYAVNLKKVMDPVWREEFPDTPETVDDSQHVGEHGRSLLKGGCPFSVYERRADVMIGQGR